ncbi:MAG: hypothetical protein GY910_21655 [bacterium]|nr:hypothetical protein [Deltaproteobacteria bacterium]MCP4907587.1 hypothetical protein [bacterium]
MRAIILVVCALSVWGCATPTLEGHRELNEWDPRQAALQAPGLPRRVLLITVAGLESSDYLDVWGRAAADGERVRMPNLARLAREGAMGIDALPPSPGASRTSHATLATGRLPAGHGIVADSTLDGEGDRALPFLDSQLLRATPLWDAAIGQGVLSLGWPTTAGARVELIVPEVDSAGSWLDSIRPRSSPLIVRALEAIAAEDLRRTSTGEASRGRDLSTWPTPAEKDAALVEVVCRVVDSERDPGLWLLRLEQTDPAQRAMGFGSVEADEALLRVDDGIGAIVGCLAAAGQLDDTAIFVVGDVAYQPVHSSVAPNVALVRNGLIGRDPRSSTGVRSWLALARSHGRSAYVYARDAANALEAREVLEAEGRRSGAFEVVSAKELARAGADPQAWFGLVAAAGYSIGGELTGAAIRPAGVRGSAGALRLGGPGEGAVGFVAWGRGIRNRVRLPTLELVDVAPTIAALLGLRLDDKLDGEAHVGLLRAAGSPPPAGPKRLGGESGGDVDEALQEMRRGRELGSGR